MESKGTDRAQRYKYLEAKPISFGGRFAQFEGVSFPDKATDGNYLAANHKYVAIPWKGAGGQVAITSAD